MAGKNAGTTARASAGAVNGRNRSRELTMEKLRQSGLEVFSRYGFDGASTKMVAHHAGINEALISRYFGGKNGLLHAILAECAREPSGGPSAYAAGRTVEEELVNFLTASIGAAVRNPAFLKLALSQALLYPRFRKTIWRQLGGTGEGRLLERLREYQKHNRIRRSADLKGIVGILHLFVAGALLHQLAPLPSAVNTQQAIRRIARAVASTLASPD